CEFPSGGVGPPRTDRKIQARRGLPPIPSLLTLVTSQQIRTRIIIREGKISHSHCSHSAGTSSIPRIAAGAIPFLCSAYGFCVPMSVAPPSSLRGLPPPPVHPCCIAILDAGAQYS